MACLEVLAKHRPDCAAVDQQGKTALHHAVEAGQIDSVEWLIYYSQSMAREMSINPTLLIDTTDKEGAYPIHSAAGTGKVAAPQLLQSHGAQLNVVDSGGRTPLHSAILQHRLGVEKYLIAQGCNVDASDGDGRTTLMLAARVNGQKSVGILLEHGVDKSKRGANDELAIHHACRIGSLTILEMLFTGMSDLEVMNRRGERPLHLAAIGNHPRIVRALLRVKCQVNPWTKPPPVSLKSKAAKPQIPGMPHRSTLLASTPLHYACCEGHYDIAAALIQHGAGFNLNQEDGTSPLILACEAASPGLVAVLIQASANVNAATSGRCLTALHISYAKNDLESTRLPVDSGADTRAKLTDKSGETPAAYGRCLLGALRLAAVNYVLDYNVKTMKSQYRSLYTPVASIRNGDGSSTVGHAAASSSSVGSTLSPLSYAESQAQGSGGGSARPWRPASYT